MLAFSDHTQARENFVDGRQSEVAGRRTGWDLFGKRIQFIESIRLSFPRMNGSPKAVKDGFYLVSDLSINRVVNGIL